MKPWMWMVVGLVVLALGVGGGYWLGSDQQPEPAPGKFPAKTSPVAANFELGEFMRKVEIAGAEARGMNWIGAKGLGSASGEGSGIWRCEGDLEDALFQNIDEELNAWITSQGGKDVETFPRDVSYYENHKSFERTYRAETDEGARLGTFDIWCVAETPDANGISIFSLIIRVDEAPDPGATAAGQGK